jgi:two-component system, LytTR family, response regulator
MSMIQIPHCHGIRSVQPEEIVRVEASSNYCKIYFASGYPLTVAKVLLWFQVHLPGEMFTRVHRSHLVNNIFIDQVNGDKHNVIRLSNGEKITMSRRRKALLMAG